MHSGLDVRDNKFSLPDMNSGWQKGPVLPGQSTTRQLRFSFWAGPRSNPFH